MLGCMLKDAFVEKWTWEQMNKQLDLYIMHKGDLTY